MAEKKYLDKDGLAHLWLLLKEKLTGKVDKEFKTGSQSQYKVLSDNNLTDDMVEKINNAGDSSFTGNYVDLTGKPQINGHELATGNNTLESLGIATKTSELTNDSKFQTDTEVDSKISAATADMATNAGVQAKITEATTDMATKTYVNQQLANINKKQVVSSTTEMTDPNTIYLLAIEGGENNVYEEYIVYNGKAEKIGTTQVDLTGYVREEDLIAITNGEIDGIIV